MSQLSFSSLLVRDAHGRYLPASAGDILEAVRQVAVLFMGTRHRLIEYREMFHGTIDGTSVYPREVVKEALRLNAAAVIVSHNHPSGDPEPSAG